MDFTTDQPSVLDSVSVDFTELQFNNYLIIFKPFEIYKAVTTLHLFYSFLLTEVFTITVFNFGGYGKIGTLI